MRFKLLMITLGYMSLYSTNNSITPAEPVYIKPVETAIVKEVSQPVQKVKDDVVLIENDKILVSIPQNEQQVQNNSIVGMVQESTTESIETETKDEQKVPVVQLAETKTEKVIESEPIETEENLVIFEERTESEPVEEEKDYVVIKDKFAIVWEYNDGIRRVGGEYGSLYKWCDETNTYVAIDENGNFYTYKVPTPEEMANGATCIGSAIFCTESGMYESSKPE